VAVLRVVRGSSPGSVIALAGERSIVGRHPNCQVVFDNAAISRHHAQILESHGSYFIEDLRSRNGTYLNGKLLDARTQLSEGDQIRLSDVVLSFQLAGASSGVETISAELDDASVLEDELTPVDRGGLAINADGGDIDDESRIFVLPDRYEEPSFEPQLVGELDSRHSEDSRSDVKPETKLRAMLSIARALGGELRVDKVLPTVLDKLFGSFPQAEQGFILLKDGDTGRLRVMATKSRTTTRKGEAVVVSMTVVRTAMESGKALLSGNVQDDSRFKKSASLSRMQIRSMMCVPLLDHQGQSIGVIQIVTRQPEFEFTREDLDLLDSVAAQAALAIENAKMHEALLEQRDMERDLDFATQVQLGFLPKSKPHPAQYAFADYYEAALRVGGDYFDYISLPDGRVAVAVGDVAGKGVPAALLMARLYASTRFQLLTNPDPVEAVNGLNTEIACSGLGHRFITFVVMVLDPEAHEVTVVNAGHPAPLMRRSNGKVEPIGREASSLPLGIMPEQKYAGVKVPIPRGATVLAFTDGITEAMFGKDIYGHPRLVAYLAKANGPIDETVKGLVEDVEEFTGAGAARDDTCVVGFQRAAR
jgi:serine phosphatase RsbU (regulator of sigma subunit)/pSer/pThr/pTyr-binding forkhead associated (FHA) protein